MSNRRQQIFRMLDRINRAEQQQSLGELKPGGGMDRAVRSRADAINTVKSDSPGSVLANSADLKVTSAGVDWRTYIHLRYPLKWFSVFHFAFGDSTNYVNVEVSSPSAMPSNLIVDIEIYPVLTDWDSTTLTYANRPTDTGDKETMRVAPVIAATMLATSSPSDYNTGSVEGATAFWGLDGYMPTDGSKAIYGFMVKPVVSGAGAFNYEYTGDINTGISDIYAGMI